MFIDTKLILLNEHIRLLAIIKYFLIIKNTNINNLSLCEENDNFFISDNKNLINISETWVSEFKKRWKLSSLKTKINRKAVKICENDYKIFLKSCEFVNLNYNKHYIFNMDQTCWRIVSNSLTTIGTMLIRLLIQKVIIINNSTDKFKNKKYMFLLSNLTS